MGKKHIPAFIGAAVGMLMLLSNAVEIAQNGIGSMRPGLILFGMLLIFISGTGILHWLVKRH